MHAAKGPKRKLAASRREASEKNRSQPASPELTEQVHSGLLAIVNRVARRTVSILVLDELLQAAVTDIKEGFGYYNVTLLLLDASRKELGRQAMAGGYKDISRSDYLQPVGLGLIGTAAATGNVIVSNDVATDPRYVGGFIQEVPTRSELCVPIKLAGEVIAVLDIQEIEKHVFSDIEVNTLETLCDQLATVINNARLFDKAQKEIAERTRIEKELRASEMRTSTILRSLPVAVYTAVVPSEEDATWISQSIERFVGCPAEKFLREPHFWSDNIHPDDQARVSRDYRNILNEGEVRLEYRWKTADGTYRWILDNALALPSEQGQPKQVIGIFMDITDRRKAEEETLLLERRMLQSQKLESLGMLAGGIAHDFNNLLMAIIGNLDIALLQSASSSETRPLLLAAQEAAQRATGLTKQLLAYSGKGTLTSEPVDLNALIAETARLFKAAVSKNTSLRMDLDPALPPIDADPSRMQQIVMNLIVNASEAIGDRLGVITMTTRNREYDDRALAQSRLQRKLPAGAYVALEVSDTGCGMDGDTMRRLFDPFFTTKFLGRGLGLSAVVGIVDSHGGAIMVESEPGAGSTFTVLFPPSASSKGTAAGRAKDSGRTVAHTDADPTVETADQGFSGTVLLVEDEESVRKTCAQLLKLLGFAVVEAESGAQAIEMIETIAGDISCAIVDMTMPGMNGIATSSALRQIRPDMRIILTSGYLQQEVESRFAENDTAGFLHKPYQLSELRAVLDRVLRSS
ncbi:MAG TPA: response regulator [Candidatus Bathyarchaeia archaeon]|nr:response regulator [Candidatus Bathyarchaeia archaeon]